MNISTKEEYGLLDHIRWISALEVVLSHVRANLLVDYPALIHPSIFTKFLYFATGFGHAAVIIFFSLSGFLVGGKVLDLLSEYESASAAKYLAERTARIFIVLWPAVALTALVLALANIFGQNAPFLGHSGWGPALSVPIRSGNSIVPWLGILTLTNEFLVPTLSVNSPLWSLACEWFYYIFALSLVLVIKRRAFLVPICIVIYSTILLLLALSNSPSVLTGGLVWSTGLISRMIVQGNRKFLKHSVVQISVTVCFVLALIITRNRAEMDTIFAIPCSALVAVAAASSDKVAVHFGKEFASFSYSLYVIHFPLIILAMVMLNGFGTLPHRLNPTLQAMSFSVVLVIICILAAKMFALLTESRTRILRDHILLKIKHIRI